MQIGAHLDRDAVVRDAARTDSNVAQVFLSSPRSWQAPKPRGDEAALRSSGLLLYVHAPYLCNPASTNPAVRNATRTALEAQSAAAATIGALGLVVHGGHPTGGGTYDDGIAGWLSVLDGAELPVRILIENTAGGAAAVARRFGPFEALIGRLRDAGHDVGVCLDTCHAHAGGEPLDDAVERLRAFAGAIDLVHANDSRDPFDSGRDRHANLGDGAVGAAAVAAVVQAAQCPAVVETPGGVAAMAADIAYLRGSA